MNELGAQKLGSSNSRCFFAPTKTETLASAFSVVSNMSHCQLVEKLPSKMVFYASGEVGERRQPRRVRHLCFYAGIAATLGRRAKGTTGGCAGQVHIMSRINIVYNITGEIQ